MPAAPYPWPSIRSRIARGFALIAVLLAVVPAIVVAQDATPAPTGAPTAMAELFGLMPAQVLGLDGSITPFVTYADIATQLESVGVAAPADITDDAAFSRWAAATRGLALPSDASSYLATWRDDFGFDLLQVDQALSIALPPDSLTLYRGRFDPGDVVTALTEAGYQPVTVNGHELLSLRGDFEIGLDDAISYPMAAMNFGVVLPDGTLAFSSAGAPLAAVLDVAAGTAPSALEAAAVATLIGHVPVDLVSATIVHGFALQMGVPPSMIDVIGEGTPDLDAVATAAAGEIAAASEMPPIALALLGSTAGGPLGDEPADPNVPAARAVALVLMPNAASAETAVPVIEQRLAEGASIASDRPYTDLFASWTVRAIPGTTLVSVDLTLVPGVPPSILIQMVAQRDLGFLAW